jgi:AraC-like DNA-binding protein
MKHSNDAPLQQAQALCGALDQLRELGVDPREACAGLAFGEQDLTPDAMIPFGDGVAFLENCQRLTGLEQFGLLAGARGDHRSFGAIGQLMDAAPTLGHAIRDFLGVQVGISLGATTYCYPLGECIALGYAIFERHHPSAIQVYGLTMAVGANMVRALTGGDVNPLEIHFCHRPPADPGVYRQVLKTKVLFDQYQSCLILKREDLERPNPRADAPRHAALGAQIRASFLGAAATPGVVLRHLIKPLVLQGAPTFNDVARNLDMHPRKLNRRLLDEGTSFIEIRDEARFRLAQELLAFTDLPIGEIASALSYSMHGSFVRAFKKRSGKTPSLWREEYDVAARREDA